MLSVISTGTKSGGWSGYESRLAAVVAQDSGCLARSTSITWSLVLVHCSPVCRTPPVSRSVIHITAVRSSPQSTRLWYVYDRCSTDSSLRATVRYSVHVRRVSSTRIPYLPSSQASRRFSICRRMMWDLVTCQARCSINIWKVMNRSKFHCLSRSPRSSPLSVPTKHLLTFPLGMS